MKKNPIKMAIKSRPPPVIALFLTGIIIAILAVSPQSDMYRTTLCGAAVFVATWGCWQRWLLNKLLFTAITPTVAGLLLGLLSTFWHYNQIETQKTETSYQNDISNKTKYINKSWKQLNGVVVDREDRFDSTRIWITDAYMPNNSWLSSGLVQITVYKKTVSALPGDTVSFAAKVFTPKSFKVPGAFDYEKFLQNKGIVATGYAKDPVNPTKTTDKYIINRARQKISNWISVNIKPENQGLVEALLVGKRGRIEPAVKEALLVSGTFHLIAISGLHLGLVAGWSFFVLRFLITLIPAYSIANDSKRPAALITLLPLITYASLAGWSLSTQRATIMVGLYLIAVTVGRGRDGFQALMLAAVILLLWHPYELFQAGFQLSFIAVTALLASWPIIKKYSHVEVEKPNTIIKPTTSYLMFSSKTHKWKQKIISLLLVTLFMQLVTLPVVTYHFHRLTPYGLIGNLLAIPWVSFLSAPLGILALIGKFIHPDIGHWFLTAMSASLEQLINFINWVAQLPFAWQRSCGPSLAGFGIATAGLAWAAMLDNKRNKILVALLAILALLLPKPTAAPEGWLHIAVLDVGQAQSIAIRSPSGDWSILDAGGIVNPRFNIGESAISAYLWHHGVETIERVIISHPQADHMAGAKRLLRNFNVQNLWLGYFPEEEINNISYRNLISQGNKSGVNIKRFDSSSTIQDDSLTIQVLPTLIGNNKTNINNRSLTIILTIGNQKFLLPSDIQKGGEKWLLKQNAIPEVTMTVAPHHGSRTSSTLPFIKAANPDHVIFSVGKNNRYLFPNTKIVERWQNSGAQLWQTDRNGTIIFQSNGEELKFNSVVKHQEP
ncbi:MAG: DNA internalization-related competence protein ComEC/Rec2 [Magnetococcales bacterium]|nr:DNA internalization-related competence protein ComEC/Rec2 [Magnetococcales bacterium]